MAGLRLAEAGREVLLLERERGPRPKVCGEFLSAEAVGYLRACGVEPVQHSARQVKRMRFSAGSRVAQAELPFPALALSRAVLDELLLKRAEACGCAVRRGVGVEKLTRTGDGWAAICEGGGTVSAAQVVLASGKHDLRGWARPAGPQNDLIGFKMRWRLEPGQAGALNASIELHHFAGGYGGLVAVEDGAANFSAVVRKSEFRRLGGWPRLLEHIRAGSRLVHDRLAGAEPEWERPLAISSIPYGYIARRADGCWRVGDQLAVIPSFTGDGMAIAMHSAALAAEMLVAGRSIDEYQRALSGQLQVGMRVATALSRLMASPIAGFVAPAAMSVLPLALRSIARATRIPARALVMEKLTEE
jgi:flavin-dependent dehydrogenase